MQVPLINGMSYDWGSVILSLNGIPVIGVKEICYSERQEVVNNYGAGRFPVSRSKGRITYTAAITLDSVEIEALQRATMGGRLQDIPPFDITVQYIQDTQEIVTHRLLSCQFVSNSREMKEGDKQVLTKLDLIVGSIRWTQLF